MKATHLKQYIIEPTLKYLKLLNDSSINLLLGIAAQESHLGEYLHQINGCALGIYQMEPRTEQYNLDYLQSKNYELFNKIIDLKFDAVNEVRNNQMEGNLYYATAMARIHFLKFQELLPTSNDIEGLATYWKKYYNTIKGQGKIVDFINNYYKYVAGED